MGFWQIQSSMNRGELVPLLVGRVDLAAYYAGVETALNVLSIPQGGLKKRPGQEYLATALGDGRLENFSFNIEQNYLLVFTDLKMQIFKDGVLQTNINGSGDDFAVTPWTLAQIRDFDYIQSADTGIVTHPDVAPQSIVRTSDTAWTVAPITFSAVTQYDYGSGAEDLWSVARGYPIACTFHEGRLWFGGFKSLPNAIAGSFVNGFFNFGAGTGLDDEGIFAILDTDQVNAVQGIFSNRSLQIFTSGGEFYVAQSPVTPSNISVSPQSKLGSRRVRPVTLEGVTLFAQRTGKAVNQFVFINEFQANQSRSISFLSPHLINTPIELVVSRGTSETDANYVYILNNDGNLTVFNTLASEGVAGFTKWETTGNIKSVAEVSEELYLLTEREINSATVYYIERENQDMYLDASTLGTGLASATLTGLSHLEGETVRVKADGSYMGEFVVTGGQITIGRVADTIEAGLNYQPLIVTMPLNVNLKNGPNASKKKKIGRVSVQMYESNGIIVNDQRIADKVIGQNQFDAPTPQTGLERMYLAGWSLEAQITISQDTPMPFTILNIGMEVNQ